MMKDRKKNLMLPLVLGLLLLTGKLVHTFVPMAILPKLDIPNLVLISLIALLLEHYFAEAGRNNIITTLLLSALSFGLLLFASGFVWLDCLKLAIAGGIVYTVTACIFDDMIERLSTGPEAKAAPVLSAIGVYLAVQCFSGIIL